MEVDVVDGVGAVVVTAVVEVVGGPLVVEGVAVVDTIAEVGDEAGSVEVTSAEPSPPHETVTRTTPTNTVMYRRLTSRLLYTARALRRYLGTVGHRQSPRKSAVRRAVALGADRLIKIWGTGGFLEMIVP